MPHVRAGSEFSSSHQLLSSDYVWIDKYIFVLAVSESLSLLLFFFSCSSGNASSMNSGDVQRLFGSRKFSLCLHFFIFFFFFFFICYEIEAWKTIMNGKQYTRFVIQSWRTKHVFTRNFSRDINLTTFCLEWLLQNVIKECI